MNKKFLLAWLLVFVAWFFGSFLIHGVLLHPDYMQVRGLFRTDADSQQYFPWMILAHVLLSGAFVWIYSRGVESRPWLAQGLRFGVAVALLAVVPNYLIYYVVQPMPSGIVVHQILFDSLLVLILGVLVAWLYRARGVRA
jgi:hypothetical protein